MGLSPEEERARKDLLRKEALSQAVRVALAGSSDASPEATVERAEAFYGFLTVADDQEGQPISDDQPSSEPVEGKPWPPAPPG